VTRRLGIDVGGSATRWCLIDDATAISLQGEACGFSGHISKPDVLKNAAKAIETILGQVGSVDRIIAGVTGLSRHTQEAAHLSALLGTAFAAPSVAVISDIELSTRAAFPTGTGILVYAGTGSVAAHMTLDGNLLTAGGKGVLIDDAGGGYWIAVAALRAVLRAEDTQPGTGWNTPLGEAFASVLGGKNWPTVRSTFYALDRGGVAILARGVGAAAQVGDATALSILRSAGEELALLAAMLTNRVGDQPIVLAGGVTTLHTTIIETMAEVLAGASVIQKSLAPAKTAAELALSTQFFNPHSG
jgi:glucosamine kinase